MSDIYEPPLDYDFGLDFDYSVWTEQTEIEFLNVPWDAMYRDVVRFANRAALNTYIDSNVGLTHSLDQMSYIKPGTPIIIDTPHNFANRFNYVRVRNPNQPIEGDIQKDFYYFVVGVEYISPNATAIYVQLDVWQTFIYDVQFGNCYIERGHIGIANTKNFDSFGRDYLTVPEGIDVGSEMRVIARNSTRIMGFHAAYDEQGNWYDTADFCVVVVATQDLTAPAYKPDGTTAQVITARGSEMEGIASGAGLYAFRSAEGFRNWMTNNSNESWRTQSVQAAYIVPNLQRYMPAWSWNEQIDHPYDLSAYKSFPRKHKFMPDWRNSTAVLGSIPARYRHLRKLFTYPYMAIQMTTWTATPIILKPESWNSPDADVLERASMMPPSQRVDVMPRGYNAQNGAPVDNWLDLPDGAVNELQRDIGDDGGEWLDFATRIQNFPSIPIVSNSGVAYLAANQASIQQSYAGADWSQQRALTGNELAFDQSSQNSRTLSDQTDLTRNLMAEMTGIGNQSMINRTNISTAQSLANGVLGGSNKGGFNPLALLGNGIDSLANNAQTLAQLQTNQDSLTAQRSNLNKSEQVTQKNMAYMRDTNLEYQNFAAKGDYAQHIAALDAKVRDAAMMQPSMSGQYGGEIANLVNNSMEISVRWKLIDNSALATIGEYWLQFGYAVHRSVSSLPANLMVMTNFTYWKLQKVYLKGANMPENMRQTIRGFLESGVTVWSDPNKIGFTDYADNQPLGGITL